MSISLNLNIENIRYGAFETPLKHNNEPVLGYLAKAKEGSQVYINQDVEKHHGTEALFEGDPSAFLEKHDNHKALLRQAKNKVRKCPNCGKPVAFTLPDCNGCGYDLSEVEIGYTNNIFMGFVYGIKKGPFPYTISIRSQTESTLVFDDLLSLTPCHLNIICGDQYLPDWRFLLINPEQGLELVNTLYGSGMDVLENQFFSNEEWRKTTFNKNDEEGEYSLDEIKGHVASGFNYPPSQYQIHLQFMLPPFLPYQYYMYLIGKHFTPGRFFPVEYVIEVLKLNVPFENLNDDTPIEDIIAFYEEKGVSYNEFIDKYYKKYGESHRLLSNWKIEDFDGIVIGDNLFDLQTGNPIEDIEVKKLVGVDKNILQNYGRPYNENGRPTGTYYRHAKNFPDGVKVVLSSSDNNNNNDN